MGWVRLSIGSSISEKFYYVFWPAHPSIPADSSINYYRFLYRLWRVPLPSPRPSTLEANASKKCPTTSSVRVLGELSRARAGSRVVFLSRADSAVAFFSFHLATGGFPFPFIPAVDLMEFVAEVDSKSFIESVDLVWLGPRKEFKGVFSKGWCLRGRKRP